jgi:WD40-like Beta Propeller Repeat
MTPLRATRSFQFLLCCAALSGCGDDPASRSTNGADAGGEECSGHGQLRDGQCDCAQGYKREGDRSCVPRTALADSASTAATGAAASDAATGNAAASDAMVDAAMAHPAASDAAVGYPVASDGAAPQPAASDAMADAAVTHPATSDAAVADGAVIDAGTSDAGAACSGQLELMPTRVRWSAYVVDDGFGTFRLWSKRGNEAPVLLHEVGSALSDLRWSDDGKWLAFVEANSDFVAYVQVVDFRGEQPLGPIPVGNWEESAGSPRWSPDSTRLVYAGVNGLEPPGLRLVDVSGASPSAPVAIAENCPQGAYAEFPCLFFNQPAMLEWSPDGTRVAFLTAPFFDDTGTGSAADLFVVAAAVGEAGVLASPFVPPFGQARRGVAAATFAWSPDGARVAYAGSFEDSGNIAEAYVFDVGAEDSQPIKLHGDLTAPNEGAQRFPMVWGSNAQVLFSSDLTTAGTPALFSVDIAATPDAGIPDGGSMGVELSSPTLIVDGPVHSAALSPDGNSLLVVSTVGVAPSGTLTVHAFDGTISNPRQVTANLTEVGGGFEAAARWAPGGSLLAFVETGVSFGSLFSMVGFLNDGGVCPVASFLLAEPEPNWNWLAGESSIVVNEPASGVRRLAAEAVEAEMLSATLDDASVVSSWAVQP